MSGNHSKLLRSSLKDNDGLTRKKSLSPLLSVPILAGLFFLVLLLSIDNKESSLPRRPSPMRKPSKLKPKVSYAIRKQHKQPDTTHKFIPPPLKPKPDSKPKATRKQYKQPKPKPDPKPQAKPRATTKRQQYIKLLNKSISMNLTCNPKGKQLTLGYAFYRVCKKAGVPYLQKTTRKYTPGIKKVPISQVVGIKSAGRFLKLLCMVKNLEYCITDHGIYFRNFRKKQKISEEYYNKPNPCKWRMDIVPLLKKTISIGRKLEKAFFEYQRGRLSQCQVVTIAKGYIQDNFDLLHKFSDLPFPAQKYKAKDQTCQIFFSDVSNIILVLTDQSRTWENKALLMKHVYLKVYHKHLPTALALFQELK